MSNQHQHAFRTAPPSSPIIRKRGPPPTQHCHRPEPPMKPKNALTLSDQIFIFLRYKKETPLMSLIQQLTGLNYTGDIQKQLQNTSFVHIYTSSDGTNIARLAYRMDDICPQQICSPKHRSKCHRLHFINSSMLCPHRICTIQNCTKHHIRPTKLTHQFLSVILSIYYRKYLYKSSFIDFSVEYEEFCAAFRELFDMDPLSHSNDMNQWKQMLLKYNKYYFDYHQQLSDKYYKNGKQFVELWLIDDTSYNQQWKLQMNCNLEFVIERICANYQRNSKECVFKCHKWNLCPYFHITPSVLRQMTRFMDNPDCRDCFYGKCAKKYHFKRSDLMESLPLIGSSLTRSDRTIEYELNQPRYDAQYPQSLDWKLIHLSDEQYAIHTQWCNTLDHIHSQYNRTVNEEEYQNHHPDEIMHGGFHRYHPANDGEMDAVTVQLGSNSIYNSIELFSKIMKIFDDLDETPIDYQTKYMEKIILMAILIPTNVLTRFILDFRGIFLNIPQKWCCNRRISIALKIEYHPQNPNKRRMIIEFRNMNPFCSVSLAKEWFEEMIMEYSKRKLHGAQYESNFTLTEFMELESCSFHFVQRCNPEFATIYFRNCRLNTAVFAKIYDAFDGIYVNVNPKNYFPNLQYSFDRKFIDYKPTIIWSLLEKENKMDLHYGQTKHIQEIMMQRINNINVQQPLFRSVSAPMPHIQNQMNQYIAPQRRTSPPPMIYNTKQHIASLPMTPAESDDVSHEIPAAQSIQTTEARNAYNVDYEDHKHEEEFEKAQITVMMSNITSVELVLDEMYENKKSKKTAADFMMEKHEAYGNLNGKACVSESEECKGLCRYCLQQLWSPQHAKCCYFIPPKVKEEYITKLKQCI